MTTIKSVFLGCVFGIASVQLSNAQVVVSGDVGFGIGTSTIFSSDDDGLDHRRLTYTLSGNVKATLDAWSAFVDFNILRRGIGANDFDQYAPAGSGSIGLHGGRTFGPAYVGAFYGQNRFQGMDAGSANGYVNGDLYGIEGEFKLNPTTSIYAQFGNADMVGDGTDTAFKGDFYRVGMSSKYNKLTVILEAEMGRSPNVFEDNGDWGEYKTLSLVGEYEFRPRLIGTVSVTTMDITANTEDYGHDNKVFVGLRVPFGAEHDRNNLTTTYNPGLAAAWAETLD